MQYEPNGAFNLPLGGLLCYPQIRSNVNRKECLFGQGLNETVLTQVASIHRNPQFRLTVLGPLDIPRCFLGLMGRFTLVEFH